MDLPLLRLRWAWLNGATKIWLLGLDVATYMQELLASTSSSFSWVTWTFFSPKTPRKNKSTQKNTAAQRHECRQDSFINSMNNIIPSKSYKTTYPRNLLNGNLWKPIFKLLNFYFTLQETGNMSHQPESPKFIIDSKVPFLVGDMWY